MADVITINQNTEMDIILFNGLASSNATVKVDFSGSTWITQSSLLISLIALINYM
jgi:hypothetical protein